jgi:hypothetical protein
MSHLGTLINCSFETALLAGGLPFPHPSAPFYENAVATPRSPHGIEIPEIISFDPVGPWPYYTGAHAHKRIAHYCDDGVMAPFLEVGFRDCLHICE